MPALRSGGDHKPLRLVCGAVVFFGVAPYSLDIGAPGMPCCVHPCHAARAVWGTLEGWQALGMVVCTLTTVLLACPQ